MNNATSTKAAPCATSLRATKICGWILALGLLKICLMVSLSVTPPPTVPVDARIDAALGDKTITAKNAPTMRAQLGVAYAAEASPTPNIPGQKAKPVVNNSPTMPTAPQTVAPAARKTTAPIPQIHNNQHVSPFSQDPRRAMAQIPVNINQKTPGLPPAPLLPKFLSLDSAEQQRNELKRREQELITLQQQMQTRLEELKRVETNVQGLLNKATTKQDSHFKHLIDVYANMKPKKAALVLADLDERISVKILAGLEADQAGQILTYMQTEPAARLSELLSKTALGS